MRKWQKAIVARVLIVSSLCLWGCFFAPPVNITGTWTGIMTWTSGPLKDFGQTITLTLLHEDREVTGTVTLPSPGGASFDLPIVQGSARSVDLSVVARGTNPLVTPEPTVEFRIDGEYEQDIMSGHGTQTIDQKTYVFTWEAVLVTEPVIPASL